MYIMSLRHQTRFTQWRWLVDLSGTFYWNLCSVFV